MPWNTGHICVDQSAHDGWCHLSLVGCWHEPSLVLLTKHWSHSGWCHLSLVRCWHEPSLELLTKCWSHDRWCPLPLVRCWHKPSLALLTKCWSYDGWCHLSLGGCWHGLSLALLTKCWYKKKQRDFWCLRKNDNLLQHCLILCPLWKSWTNILNLRLALLPLSSYNPLSDQRCPLFVWMF